MQDKTRLIILEGFDRTGKDHLLSTLQKMNREDDSFAPYFQYIPPTKPDYRKDPIAFREWLIKHIGNQVDELVDLSNDGKKTIVLVRLLLTDVVYSTLFNREQAVNRFHAKIFQNFEVENNVFLFKNYDEYLKRLDILKDKEIEYSRSEFERVNDLYVESAKQFEKMGARSRFFYINGDQFLDQFAKEVLTQIS